MYLLLSIPLVPFLQPFAFERRRVSSEQQTFTFSIYLHLSFFYPIDAAYYKIKLRLAFFKRPPHYS
jgi:hypothetical protein